MQSLRQYLLLIRLPNVFTVPTNILVGYFSLTSVSDANIIHISMLMVSSALLYIAGIVFNDYFDLSTDRKERPSRPLPSGRISMRSALVLAIVTLMAANVVAFMVSIASLIITAMLSSVILAYDYRVKRVRLGPATMGLARFLNVFLGASPALLLISDLPWMTLFAAVCMFAYVYSITLMSRREVGQYEKGAYNKSIIQSFAIITGIVASVVAFAFYQGTPEMSVNIALFSLVMFMVVRYAVSDKASQEQRMQKAVGNLVLSIILLDSIFIAAFAGLYYGIASLAIIVPPVILARKLYVT